MAKKTVAAPVATPPSRADRIVSSLLIAMFAITVGAIIALFIAGANAKGSIWATVELLPLIALPAAFVLLIVLIARTAVRRGRDARDAGK